MSTKFLNPLLLRNSCTADKMPHSSAEKLGLLSDGVGSEGKGYIPSDKPYSRRLSRSTKTFLTTFLVLLLLYAYRAVEDSKPIKCNWPTEGDYCWGDVCSPHSHYEIDIIKIVN